MRRCLAALVAVLGLVTSACGVLGGGGSYTVEADFARAYNLFPGSPVRVLGVNVGVVADVITEEGDDVVSVALKIDDDVQLPQDVRAVIVPSSVLGERYVQLDPPFTGGPSLAPEALIPIERTVVPSEFDEILESLNSFVGQIDPDEFGRMLTNIAGALDGNGEQLGITLEKAREAVGVLRDNDEELVDLARRLSDFNEVINQRDEALGRLITDFDTLMRSLANDRTDLNAALNGLVRISDQLATLLEEHRPGVEADIETLTRVGRTAQRNLDQLSRAILWQAELYRHADRAVNHDKNWLPLVDHGEGLPNAIAASLTQRLSGLCQNAGLPPAECEQLEQGRGTVPDQVCMPPVVACAAPDEEGPTDTLGEVLRRAVDAVPALADVLAPWMDDSEPVADDPPDEPGAADEPAAGQGGVTP